MSIKDLPDAGDQTPPVFDPPEDVKQQSLVGGKNIRLSNILVRTRKQQKAKKTSALVKLLVKTTKVIDETDYFVFTAVEQRKNTTTLQNEVDPNGLIFGDDEVGNGSQPSVSLPDGSAGVAVDDLVTVILNSKTGEWFIQQGGGGAERPYVVTPNDTYPFGAILERPNGPPVTTFEEAQGFWISTPWGTRVLISGDDVVSPVGYGFFADVVEGEYYKQIDDFFIVPTGTYPSSGNIINFKLYLAKSATSLLLGNTATADTTPDGSEADAEGFDNTTASSTSRSYFGNKPFDCSYNPLTNLFLIDHPIFN